MRERGEERGRGNFTYNRNPLYFRGTIGPHGRKLKSICNQKVIFQNSPISRLNSPKLLGFRRFSQNFSY